LEKKERKKYLVAKSGSPWGTER